MVREKHFLVIPERVCLRTDLSCTEKMVLSRIMAFDVCSESNTECAKVLGVSSQVVARAKQRLAAEGFIEDIGNSGRGKTYIVSTTWKQGGVIAVEEPEPIAKREVVSRLRPSTPIKKVSNEWAKWRTRYPELLPILDRAMNYLTKRGIPLTDPKALRRSMVVLANMYKNADEPEAHVYLLQTYFDYLESDEYLYQLEHTKYCPSITNQNDLFGKFGSIREFKNDPRRHYDPTKTLTR